MKINFTLICITLIFFVLSCSSSPEFVSDLSRPDDEVKENSLIEEKNETLVSEKITDPIDVLISKMTLEEKIGQLIFISLRENNTGKSYININEEISSYIDRIKPGGVILFGENIHDIPQVTKFIKDLQNLSSVPLFIAADIEGGSINRLRSSEEMHGTKLPTNERIGKTGDVNNASIKAEIIGKELFSLGINMNLAPVADVLTNPLNTVIGNRSFGSDPLLVAEMISTTVHAMRKERVATVLKHFPGHGDTLADSHTGDVIVNYDLERLSSQEFVPFQSGIASGTDGIMTAHIQMPIITGNNLPATLSPKIITEVLRGNLGFDGLVITDSLGMGAITRHWKNGEAAVLAIDAGVDILLNPYTADEAYDALLNAYKLGKLSIERIDKSVYRIVKSKLDLGIMDIDCQYTYHKDFFEDPESIVGSKAHLDAAKALF